MAEVFKFDDLKLEGSEAAVKVRISCVFRFFELPLQIHLFLRFRLLVNIANKEKPTLSKTVTLSSSNLTPELD